MILAAFVANQYTQSITESGLYPPTTLTDKNLLIRDEIDPMFLPEALPTNDMIDPKLTKKIREKKVTLLLT